MSNDDTTGTIHTRRQALKLFGLSALTLGTTSSANELEELLQADLVVTPESTEGPFYEDAPERSNLIEGAKHDGVTKGVPLVLKLKLLEIERKKGVPLQGARIDIWHCDAEGVYSDEAQGMNARDTRGEKWCRGYQRTDASGIAEFQTIYPGHYMGRTVHIHFKVTMPGKTGKTYEFTSQLYFDEELNDEVMAKTLYKRRYPRTKNDRDGIYSARQADNSRVGSHLMLRTTKGQNRHEAQFTIAVNFE